MKNKVAIIDYGAGNIQSVQFALERIGVKSILTSDPKQIAASDKVIFPGVGHASPALIALKKNELDSLIPKLKQPVLGICLGMHLLCNFLEENNQSGLGVFSVNVRKFSDKKKVPHMGWNTIEKTDNLLFEDVPNNAYLYFVHSFFANVGKSTIAASNYGLNFSSALQKDNFYGCQFHPEKSGIVGQKILKNFIEM
jgi:imidazole glycerol-phosphate synthase subunit HisH